MREIFATVARQLEDGTPFALATLVALREVATAPLGTTICVDERGKITGNVGAGCYEAAIVEACVLAAKNGRSRVLDIDLDSDDGLTGGAACGASMRLVVWRPGPEFRDGALAIAAGDRDVDVSIEAATDRGPVSFEHRWSARRPLILVGATALAAEIATIARRLDFRVVVVDPRPAFATRERIPDADELIVRWPDEYLPAAITPAASVVVLSHDEKFDLPSLRCALASDAAFVGLLGSRRTQAARRAKLRAQGIGERAIARIHGPVGLDIGGTTAAETALSILAEIVAARGNHGGAPLAAGEGSIHGQDR